jgi:tetratricopeptide (TPR) repeat protein
MGKFIDAFARSKPRLLAMSPFIAAGALASVAMPPSLSTGTLIAVLQTLGNLAGNIAAADMHAALAERVLRGDVLKNHDLARAIRDAIGAIIHAAAQEISDEKQRAALERMARVEESVWAEAETTLWQSQTIEGLSAQDALEMFSKSPEDFANFKALDFGAWREIVGGLAAANSFALEGDVLSAPGNLKLSRATVDLVAARLHETFPRALYEILKEDFAHDGKAYGGLLIKLVGNISARQVETRETAYEILSGTRKILATVERTEDKVDQLLVTGERAEGKVDQVLEKLDSFQGQPAASTPVRLAINLPPYNQIFTGREEVLDALKAELEQNGRAAFSGMPGVGKTQTANEYAHRQYAAEAYDYVLYARAASETELLTDFVGAAQALNLPGKGDANFNVVAATVKAWLEGAERWLLIFDNADDLSVVRSHLPANPNGHVLFTRRPKDAGGVARTIKIDTMPEDEGALLLLRRAELIEGSRTLDSVAPEIAQQAREIARELDGLPLSLDIAGAFIKGTSTRLDEYLTLYHDAGEQLRQERDPNASYEHSVSKAFALAFKQVATPADDSEESAIIARAAADLLRLCAFLAPDAIPLELILADASNLGEDLQRVLGNPIWRKKTIAKATRYSLLDANPQSQTYDMHREVQAVLRDEMDEAQRLWADRALQSLLSVLPDIREFANWETCDLLVPHARACLEHSDRLKIETETVALLKNQTGFHLDSRGRYDEAEPLYKEALELRRKLFGEEHNAVAQSINNLAALYHAQGRYDEAEPLFEQTLELRKRLPGQERSELARSLNNLAELYRTQGRYEEAEPLYEQALHLWKKLHGEEHPDVALAMNNLALLYHSQKRYEDAKPLFEQTLELWKRELGEEHPDVALAMNNLALLYDAQGQYEGAEQLYTQALAMFERTLGANHPSTRIARTNCELFKTEKAERESKQSNVEGDQWKDKD